jgi:leucyl-tRNA synthetase
MSVGKFKGELVQEARVKVRASMIKNGIAFAYAKPEGLVISRSADKCIRKTLIYLSLLWCT